MASKKNNGGTSQPQAALPGVPSGYKRRASEVTGFWTPGTKPVHFIPREVHASDSSIDNRKVSLLILGESVGNNDVMTNAEDGEQVTAQQGDLIGVWYKPGMRTIKDLAGVPVFMFMSGEKDTGKPSKMKVFEVLSPKMGRPLMVTGDYRKDSAHVELPFDVKGGIRTDVPEAYADSEEA